MIVGGLDQYGGTLNDVWLCDTTTKLWKKVLFLVTVLCVHKQAIMFYCALINLFLQQMATCNQAKMAQKFGNIFLLL